MSAEWFAVRKAPVEVEARGPISDPEQIETPEGTMDADAGDYIVRGVEGEVYPVKPDIFSKTYQRIGANMDVALKEEERMTLIKQLMTCHPNSQQSSPEETPIDDGQIEVLLDKLSPNWREANSSDKIRVRSITVHRSVILEDG